MKTIAALYTSEWLSPNIIAALSVLYFIQGATGINRSLRFSFAPATAYNYTVLEGDNVDLICDTDDSSSVEISNNNMDFVKDGNLLPSALLTHNISSRKNKTAFVLSLHNVTRNSSDFFHCQKPHQNLVLTVLHSPSREYPLVTSHNYKPQYFCDNEQHGPLHLNCTTETGNPSVNISLHIEKEGGEQPVSDYIITRRDNFIDLSFVTYLNSSFNAARLVCSITQQLPALYENYNKSRFVDISPPASLHIHPSHYILSKEGEVITLICSSNVNGFVLEWIDIPLEDNQYNISTVNNSIKLVIFDYGSIANGSIIVQCRGSCGGREISQEVTIQLNNEILEDGEDENEKKKEFSMNFGTLTPLCIIMVIIISFVISFLVLKYKKKRHSMSKAGGVNKNNEIRVRSNSLTEREQLRYPDTESRSYINGEEIVNEPNNEKEKVGRENQNLTTTDNASQNNSSMDMIDNPNYEPFKSKIDSEINGMDEGYATVC